MLINTGLLTAFLLLLLPEPAMWVKTDPLQKTGIHGIFACGDNTTRIRKVANEVAMGTTAGMMVKSIGNLARNLASSPE